MLLDGGRENWPYRRYALVYLPTLNGFLEEIMETMWRGARAKNEPIDPDLFYYVMVYLEQVIKQRGFLGDAQTERVAMLDRLAWSSPNFSRFLHSGHYGYVENYLMVNERGLEPFFEAQEVELTIISRELANQLLRYGLLAISDHFAVSSFLKAVGPKYGG